MKNLMKNLWKIIVVGDIHPTSEDIVNADLIAAAPDLLMVLEKGLQDISQAGAEIYTGHGMMPSHAQIDQCLRDIAGIVKDFRAAIAKAKGNEK